MNAHLKSSNQLLVEIFMVRIGKAQIPPVIPIMPDRKTRVLRARLMLEECLETIQRGLGVTVGIRVDSNEGTYMNNKGQESVLVKMQHLEFSADSHPSFVEIADGLADQEVVNLGTASACGLALQPFFDEVMNNNFLKFGPGHRVDEGGKLIKPPGHVAPRIEAELEAQGFQI